jgi:hypothetical protein
MPEIHTLKLHINMDNGASAMEMKSKLPMLLGLLSYRFDIRSVLLVLKCSFAKVPELV